MATLVHKRTGEKYRTSNTLEIQRLVNGFGYEVEEPSFDPGEHDVKTVQEYIEDNPADASRVIEAERSGKARKTIVGED
jgi:hypothetical protein